MIGRDLVERIVSHHLGGAVLSAEPVAGGYSGAGMHRVRALLPGGERELVLKTARVADEPGHTDEQRVYGTHPGSLGAVHALLWERGLPTYDLLGWGVLGLVPGARGGGRIVRDGPRRDEAVLPRELAVDRERAIEDHRGDPARDTQPLIARPWGHHA